MSYISLDMVIRSTLLQKGYPLHWYVDALIHGREIVRDISYDVLPVITPVVLVPNAQNAVDLPCAFHDIVKFGVEVGQKIRILVSDDSINRIVNTDSNGNPIRYTPTNNNPNSPTNLYYTYPVSYFWGVTPFNEYGEFTGKLFGWGDSSQDTYKYIVERNQIQLNENIVVDKVYLEYIDNGMTCSAASKINSYAMRAISTYILWQFKEMNRNYSLGECQAAKAIHDLEMRKLIARIDPLTVTTIKRIVTRNYVQTPKYN